MLSPGAGPRQLPPGPRLPAVVQAAVLFRDPPGALLRWQRRYGDVFLVRLPGFGELVYVATPDLARQVYTADAEVAQAGEARRPFLGPVVGDHSLLCLEGEAWKRHRALLTPAFHGRQVSGWSEEIASIAERAIVRWPCGEPIALRPRFQEITLEVILRVVFGVRDAERLDRMGRAVCRVAQLGSSPFVSGVPALRERLGTSRLLCRMPRNPVRRLQAARRELDALLAEEIFQRRRQEFRHGGSDALSLLLEARDANDVPLSNAELQDELVTLLEAGHETTATALAWAFERLARHPRVVRRLREELADGQGEYLGAVVREVLRTRPVVIDTPRRLARPLRLAGYLLPAGSYVAPAIPLVHRTNAFFPDADSFRPERFLEKGGLGPAWIPFGGGHRRCLGQQLAVLELQTIIPAVLAHTDVRAIDGRPEAQRLRHVTLAPARDARVVLGSRAT